MTDQFPDPLVDSPTAEAPSPATAVLAGGCFWCVEAVYLQLKGVLGVRSGYAGGTADTANYQAVCTGSTNHAEVIEVRYDPTIISFAQLLKVFFSVAHDPTQLDRQGHDRGRQYRSAIFYSTKQQQSVAAAYIAQLDDAAVFDSPIVTRLEPLEAFFVAEAYHHNYAALNPSQPYVRSTALPKVDKVRKVFADRLK